jgi:hypothetical protein
MTRWLGVRALRTPSDLLELIPDDLAEPFDTRDLARSLEAPRWLAQKIAYCLRQTGAASVVGKRGNAMLYEAVRQSAPPRVKKRRGERVA